MPDLDKQIYTKLLNLFEEEKSEEQIIAFLNSLSQSEYERIIAVFKSYNFPDFQPGAQEKLVTLLEAISQAIFSKVNN